MSGMSDREKAFENKFAHDQELRFKAEARRNKLIGLWAAGLLGKADADAYAKSWPRISRKRATKTCCASCAPIFLPVASRSPMKSCAQR